MGSSGRHRQKLVAKPLRTALITVGIAVIAATAGALALVGSDAGSSAKTRSTARTARSQPAPAPAASATRAPERAARGVDRAPIVSLKTVPPQKKRVLSSGSCQASFYGSGQLTASGERFDPSRLTAAHKTLPMGSKVRVINSGNDKSVIVRINDRGPFVTGRCLDLSTAAMRAVGGTGSGVINVRYEVLSRG